MDTNNKMDRWTGVDWMVSFKRSTRDNPTHSIKITAPCWNVHDARQWIMDATGCHVAGISRCDTDDQPIIQDIRRG